MLSRTIKEIMRDKKCTMVEVGKLIGLTKEGVFNLLTKPNKREEHFSEILNYMDCEIIIRTKIDGEVVEYHVDNDC